MDFNQWCLEVPVSSVCNIPGNHAGALNTVHSCCAIRYTDLVAQCVHVVQHVNETSVMNADPMYGLRVHLFS